VGSKFLKRTLIHYSSYLYEGIDMNILKNKVILLTGGTGSFGSKFSEILLKNHDPDAIRIFSRGEKKQLDMANKFKDERLRFFIGDVRDKNRLHRAMTDVDIVVHAAALKQVPACEYNPIEAVRTNVDGAINVIDTAIDNEVERIMAISTDKAVHPVNLYGGTKMTAEKLFIQGNSYSGAGKTKFSCVRYGNVIGSRGSVIPLFLEQKKRGRITITDKKMTRFWITLEQGVNFVINCINRMNGGEIFVPKIASMKIMDLAEAIAPDAEKKVTGIRPGEKIHEILLTEDEARHSKEFEDYFVIEPEHPFWTKRSRIKGGKNLPEGFRYTSDNNKKWLTKKELAKIIKEL
jgi:UDP-N-acetylglucosamine 4,6-dehydratase (inverting)